MVGALGFQGCMTEEMPAAKKGTRPASGSMGLSEPVAARYASGGMLPYTTDTFTPAFSHTLPPSSTRVMPPPPPGRVQASWWNFLPSSASMAATMESCASRMQRSKRPRMLLGSSTPSRSRLAGTSVTISSASMAAAKALLFFGAAAAATDGRWLRALRLSRAARSGAARATRPALACLAGCALPHGAAAAREQEATVAICASLGRRGKVFGTKSVRVAACASDEG
mmetsp:Transcript_15462/g.38619  ORF Transcript_15462/g.38619 Transcript_15462/m.38619 type:complete len:226 (-) Transcript_15462:32-709(-)